MDVQPTGNHNKIQLDPFGSTVVEDYDRLCKEFGISLFKHLLRRIPDPNMLMRRGIIFGHRDFERILDAIENRGKFAVMSGIKPTGQFHLGTLLTAKEIVYFQNLGASAFYCIADIEAYEDNRIPFEKSEKNAVGNVADILALGLTPKNAHIYRQSKEIRVKDLAIIFGRALTLATAKAIYGERHIGLYLSALIQSGDILLPQLDEFGGPQPTVVPVGVDQDPHLRLTRDLAKRFYRRYKFIPPSATYHKLIKGLSGSAKMSKRDAVVTSLTLNEKPKTITRKISAAFTGGRATISEQRKLGGTPEICPIYDLCLFHFRKNDKDVLESFIRCKNGELLCGEHKEQVIKLVVDFVKQHQRKKRKFIGKAREILETT